MINWKNVAKKLRNYEKDTKCLLNNVLEKQEQEKKTIENNKVKINYNNELVIALDSKMKNKIVRKFEEIAEEVITDEFIEALVLKAIETTCKSYIYELLQSKEFKANLAEVFTPTIYEKLGIKK